MPSAAPAARRRLLFLCNNGDYFLAHWAPRAAAAAAAGFDVRVAVPNPALVADVPWTWQRLPLDRRSLGPVSNLASLVAALRLVRRARPDLVVSVTVKPNVIAGLAALVGYAPAVVMNVTGLGYLFLNERASTRAARRTVLALLRRCAARARVWLVYENAEDRALLLREGVGTADRALLLGGAGVDVEAFRPTPPDAGDAPLVLLPSRMLWDKGVGEFVAAAGQLRAAGVRARFALVGTPDPGNPSTVPEAQLRAWREAGEVEWWGHRSDMPAVLASASIVCLPSYREGLSRLLLEAAAAGRAIVTTDAPGCRDVVRHGETGLLVPPRDATALAGAIRELLTDAALRERLAAAARQDVVARYDERAVIARTLALYEAAADPRPAGTHPAHGPLGAAAR